MSFEIKGFDKLQEQLSNLSRKAQELDGTHNVPLNDLLTPSFMSAYSSFSTNDNFFGSGGFDVSSPEAFQAIPDEELDTHVRKNTSFDSWKEMLQAASSNWVKQRMGL